MVAAWLKEHFLLVWRVVFCACALPGAILLLFYYKENLGPNPLETLLHVTGRSALIILAITLTITPLRRWMSRLSKATHRRYGKRLSDWNWMIRLRRQLGLWCFAYATGHAWVYVEFDLDYDWNAGYLEMWEKSYLFVGFVALVLLVPLAATSTQAMIRRLGRNWRRLHTLTYLVAITSLAHFWLLVKPGLWTPWPETVALVGLLGYRLALRTGLLARWDGDDGKESVERPPRPQPSVEDATLAKESQ